MASADTSEIPAGYFSTFSIVDPNNPAPENLARTQKRNRRVFVCIPCHRRKLKCDKLLPCSRCVAAGIADECDYQPPPSPAHGRGRRSGKKAAADKAAKDAGKPGLKFKTESSPAPSFSLSSSSPSSDPSSSPQSTTTRSKKTERTTSSISESTTPARKTSYPTTEDEDDEYQKCGLPNAGDGSGTKPLNGASHWTRIACEFKDAVPYLFGTEAQWQQRYRQVKSLQCLFPSLDDNINFPFSNTNPASKAQILNSFPPNHIVDALVANYLDTFGATHCLFHPPQLRCEIRQFYEAPSDMPDGWLAQLCMVLALGAETSSDFLFSGSGQSAAEWGGIFLNAAQASFGRSSYMVAPTLATVRTLCMMVLAKLIEAPASGGSCSGSGGGGGGDGGCNSGGSKTDTNGYTPLVSLMAFALRMATSLQLHRSTATTASAITHLPDGIDKWAGSFDTEMRRRIWVTVRLLDLDTAMRAGTTMHGGACDAEPPQPLADASMPPYDRSDGANIYNTPGCFRDSMCEGTECHYVKTDTSDKKTSLDDIGDKFSGDLDGLYQHKLATFLPLLANIINAANSPTKPNPSYERVKFWDARTRKCLHEFRSILLSNAWQRQQQQQQQQQQGMLDTLAPSQMQRATTQCQYLETMTHRALLTLHHNFFHQSLPSSGAGAPSARDAPPKASSSSLYAMSQAAVVESSLALLSTHKTWVAALTSLAERCPSTCTNMTTTATAASVDSPFSLRHQPASGGGVCVGVPGMIKSTAAEMIIQPPQPPPPTVPLSGRSSPTMFGGGSEAATMAATAAAAAAASSCTATAAASAAPMRNTGWLLDLCHDDFGAALMYMVLVLRAAHYHGGPAAEGGILGCHEAVAVAAVRHSYQIMRDRSYRSVAHFKEFLGVAILFACFRGLRAGDMLAQVVDATNDVEQVVVAGRRYLLWAAESFAAPDEALLGFGGGPLMGYAGM